MDTHTIDRAASSPSDVRTIDRLTVFFDADCGLCWRARHWLAKQTKYLPLDFVSVQSSRREELLPGVDTKDMLRELTVLRSNGALYRGAKAWIVCLWALRKYRSWSLRLANPALYPLAKRAISIASSKRHSINVLMPSTGSCAR